MKDFRDIPLNERVKVLKELPRGSMLTYHNRSSRYDKRQVIKMGDHNWLMIVLLDGVQAPIHYKNLCCDEFETFISVVKRLNGN